MYDLSGKVALITGSGGERGIGRAIAVRLAREGADVVVNDPSEKPHVGGGSGWHGVLSVVEEIESLGRNAIHAIADVSDAVAVQAMVDKALDRFGRVDILVNNASSTPGGDRVPVVDLEESEWDMVQRVNSKGSFLCSRAVARTMIDHAEGGKIIMISSLTGKVGRANFAAYGASKMALIGFTRCLAMELASSQINVNAICPGMVDTERMTFIAEVMRPEGVSVDQYLNEMRTIREPDIPLGRVAQAHDVAKTAAFLASAESDYITGQTFNVSGGTLMD